MKFKDIEITNCDSTDPNNIPLLIIKYLCGEDKRHNPKFSKEDRKLLVNLIDNAIKRGLNYKQFNELLLLLNQDRVGEDFFKLFFEKDRISPDDLKKGITKFRCFAMLCFGNFRFAYKQLTQKSENKLKEKLSPYWRSPSELEKEFKKRPSKMLETDNIERDKTWYLGELSGKNVNEDTKLLEVEKEKAKKGKSKYNLIELFQFGERLSEMDKHIQEVQERARRNTDIYLTWDYMDIYIATSMRNRWEFEELFDFVERVLRGERLEKLNIRFFDPTQSKCGNPKDKGLVEGLMLNRTLCTIYLAQESDTMGKDSELAATLAQSKPVIAYVPKYKPLEYSQKIMKYPLDFFKKRFLILNAEGVFSDYTCIKRLERCDSDFENKIGRFLDKLIEFFRDHPFSLWTEKETEFKKKYKDFQKICEILAIAECYNFDRRADIFKRHPLSMQVDLQSGVANGVLVVRKPEECARLLYRILTNQVEFTIKHITYKDEIRQRKEGYTILEENISKSAFRVVTDQERLTNSFWNLFETSAWKA